MGAAIQLTEAQNRSALDRLLDLLARSGQRLAILENGKVLSSTLLSPLPSLSELQPSQGNQDPGKVGGLQYTWLESSTILIGEASEDFELIAALLKSSFAQQPGHLFPAMMIGQLARAVAHDVNNQLSIGLGNLSRFGDNERLSDEEKRPLLKAEKAMKAVSVAMQKLGSYSRSRVTETKVAMKVSEIVSDSLVLITKIFKNDNVLIEGDAIANDRIIEIDKIALGQVLLFGHLWIGRKLQSVDLPEKRVQLSYFLESGDHVFVWHFPDQPSRTESLSDYHYHDAVFDLGERYSQDYLQSVGGSINFGDAHVSLRFRADAKKDPQS